MIGRWGMGRSGACEGVHAVGPELRNHFGVVHTRVRQKSGCSCVKLLAKQDVGLDLSIMMWTCILYTTENWRRMVLNLRECFFSMTPNVQQSCTAEYLLINSNINSNLSHSPGILSWLTSYRLYKYMARNWHSYILLRLLTVTVIS